VASILLFDLTGDDLERRLRLLVEEDS